MGNTTVGPVFLKAVPPYNIKFLKTEFFSGSSQFFSVFSKLVHFSTTVYFSKVARRQILSGKKVSHV